MEAQVAVLEQPNPLPAVRMNLQQDTYQIQLPQFEGPFDLLLFFIERDELSVHDIPIAKITLDFLAYLREMGTMAIEIGSEFTLVAAQLMKIKAQMLLPRPQVDENGEEIDPRAELVDRLLLYKQYRQSADAMDAMALQHELIYSRGGFLKQELEMVQQYTEPSDELIGLTLFHLAKTYERVLKRKAMQAQRPRHVIQRYPYSVEGVRDDILRNMQRWHKIDFNTYVKLNPEKLYVVFSLLVILDLVQQQTLGVVVGEGFNNFWLLDKQNKQTTVPELPAPGETATEVTVEILPPE